MVAVVTPKILVIDDLYGRTLADGRNREREDFCTHFNLRDVHTSRSDGSDVSETRSPALANASFCRGQLPSLAQSDDIVRNDLPGLIERVNEGWDYAFARGKAPWSLVLLDMCFYTGRVTERSQRLGLGMPEGAASDDIPSGYFGLMALDALHVAFPELPIIVFSSMPRRDISLEFSRRGALGFIARDDANGPALLREAIEHHALIPDETGSIVGCALPLLLMLREAKRAAKHRQHLLLAGERGTGKELLANFVHRCQVGPSGGRTFPLVAVNAATLRNDLLAAELFGIEPRTASGVEGKIGLLETAHGGDLFLDEIGDLSMEAQSTLLRTLQEGQVMRVGGRVPRSIDVRVLAATNADLDEPLVGFRADLLDRLRSGGTLTLPPLRNRRSDIPAIVMKFVRDAEKLIGALHREVSDEAMDLLRSHDWPGNIRELRNCVFDAVSRHNAVEHMVPGHLRLLAARETAIPMVLVTAAPPVSTYQMANSELPSGPPSTETVDRLLRAIDSCDFSNLPVESWCGRYGELNLSMSRLQARYLQAALAATCRRTAERPDGILLIHPAVKLLVGDDSITASQAADFVKRVLVPLENELKSPLDEALSISLRLRPRSRRKLPT